jgi:hypothetical protein
VVDINGKGDYPDLQTAINNLPAAGGRIFVKAGVYPITSTIKITTSNVHIQGEGMGITKFIGDMTGNTPAMEAYNKAVGTPRNLVNSTLLGDTKITTSPADAASFASGEYVLLYSDKVVDTEDTGKHAGEVKQIPLPPFDPTSGVIPVDDQIFDTYTLADSAQVVSITMLQNITLSDFSITTTASSSTLNVGFTHFRFIENLQIERIEVRTRTPSSPEQPFNWWMPRTSLSPETTSAGPPGTQPLPWRVRLTIGRSPKTVPLQTELENRELSVS